MAEQRSSILSPEAADWLLAALGNERLCRALVAVPALQDSVFRGGFQPVPATLDKPAVRRRLHAALLARFDRLEPLLRAAVGPPWASAGVTLQALDTAWLLQQWRPLLRGTGSPAYAVAMALDSRVPVRARGLRLLRCRSLWVPTWQPRPEALPAALRELAPAPPAEPRPAPAPAAAPAAAVHDLGVLRDALARQREKLRECEQDLRQVRLQSEQREKDLRRDLRDARAAAEKAFAEVDARVAAAVACFREEALGLTPACAPLAAAAADPATGELMARAERVLAEQRRQNELYGTYAALRSRIRELRATAQRLGVCMDESVKVLPEVRSVHAAICREVDRLQALLPGADPPVTELAAQLLARIKEPRPAAAALPELDRLESILGTDVIAELLGEPGLSQVRAALSRRRRLVTEAVQASPETPPAAASRSPRELWDVRAALSAAPAVPVHVFIDGYNAIRRVPDLAAIEESSGLARSRDVLCELCRRRGPLLAHVEIVFDGQGALSAREARDGLTVVFSNGLRDSQNADQYLLQRVARARADGVAVWLVTDDRGLRAQAAACCDAYIASPDWYRFVS